MTTEDATGPGGPETGRGSTGAEDPEPGRGSTDRGGPEPCADAVVDAAVEAAEGVIFSRYGRSEVEDVDVTVRFEAGVLEVDVYLNVPGAADEERVAEDAALAARHAVDELFGDA